MMDSYGRYKSARNAAWQCLLDYHITELPVNLLRIVQESGIEVRKNSSAHILTGGQSGILIKLGNIWYLVYDDECVIGRRRFTIAHELGHLFLGHPFVSKSYGIALDSSFPDTEMEADLFASRLLMPACVLWKLGATSAEDISRVCNVSRAAASNRERRMKILLERNAFLSSPLEQKVFEQFRPWIEKRW